MSGHEVAEAAATLPAFSRKSFATPGSLSRIGTGRLGGKARGLVTAARILDQDFKAGVYPGLEVGIPALAVLATDVFDAFLEQNRLRDLALSDAPDERIAHAFQQADLPVEILGDLRAMVDEVHVPLAVRSSSLMEDALFRPFAGVYETKMTPNNQPEASARFQKLAEAIKFVFASTFFRAAKTYIRATRHSIEDEKMAVVIQHMAGARHQERFYPHLSGVGRSYNYYPTGPARREEGVVDLALGLGKTIVDGGVAYSYSPAHPRASMLRATARDRLQMTQLRFWAVNMGALPAFDPVAETEYMTQADLEAAEYDGTLDQVASTFVAESERFVPGVGRPGPRVIDFAPLLQIETYPVNRAVRDLLAAFEKAVGRAVEIEFAVVFPAASDDPKHARLAFLQVRPMVVSDETVELEPGDLSGPDVLLASDQVLGNGEVSTIRDVVYVRPDRFDFQHSRTVAGELERMNATLLEAGSPYLLLGFGRWGSADPWLGIPVQWGQICGAGTIVEAAHEGRRIDPSQGSHFFQNLSSFGVPYFTLGPAETEAIAWSRLEALPAAAETEFVRHVRLEAALRVRVDGRTGRGGVWFPRTP